MEKAVGPWAKASETCGANSPPELGVRREADVGGSSPPVRSMDRAANSLKQVSEAGVKQDSLSARVRRRVHGSELALV